MTDPGRDARQKPTGGATQIAAVRFAAIEFRCASRGFLSGG